MTDLRSLFLKWFPDHRTDGRPYSADKAIVVALAIDDDYARADFLRAWSEGRWGDCLKIQHGQPAARSWTFLD